jgi:hypothetical protein
MKPSLQKVRDLYPEGKIICVEEYFTPEKKWTSLLSDGTDVRDPDLYYTYGLNFVLEFCVREGAEKVTIKVVDKDDKVCYPDYRVEELYEN